MFEVRWGRRHAGRTQGSGRKSRSRVRALMASIVASASACFAFTSGAPARAESSAPAFFRGSVDVSLLRLGIDTPGFLPISGLVDLSIGRATTSNSTNSDSLAEAGMVHPGWAKSYQAVPSLLGLPVPSDALPEIPGIVTATYPSGPTKAEFEVASAGQRAEATEAMAQAAGQFGGFRFPMEAAAANRVKAAKLRLWTGLRSAAMAKKLDLRGMGDREVPVAMEPTGAGNLLISLDVGHTLAVTDGKEQTSAAKGALTGLSLLGGAITLDSVNVSYDATAQLPPKAATEIAGLRVAGIPVALNSGGFRVTDAVAVPLDNGRLEEVSKSVVQPLLEQFASDASFSLSAAAVKTSQAHHDDSRVSQSSGSAAQLKIRSIFKDPVFFPAELSVVIGGGESSVVVGGAGGGAGGRYGTGSPGAEPAGTTHQDRAKLQSGRSAPRAATLGNGVGEGNSTLAISVEKGIIGPASGTRERGNSVRESKSVGIAAWSSENQSPSASEDFAAVLGSARLTRAVNPDGRLVGAVSISGLELTGLLIGGILVAYGGWRALGGMRGGKVGGERDRYREI